MDFLLKHSIQCLCGITVRASVTEKKEEEKREEREREKEREAEVLISKTTEVLIVSKKL